MSVAWWWSYLLAALGVTGMRLSGNQKVLGWQIALLAQLAWITYAVVSGQWGFIFSALTFAAVAGRNVVKWRRRDREAAPVAITAGGTTDG